MSIRLRALRRERNLTLAQVAAALGTTPQTVSRLENRIIALSADWLEKFSALYGVPASELLGQAPVREIPQLGLADPYGMITGGPCEPFILSVPAERPLAVRLSTPLGGYLPGDILIAAQSAPDDVTAVVGKNAVVGLADGSALIRRVTKGREGTMTLVPLDPGQDCHYDVTPVWVAKIIMRISYV